MYRIVQELLDGVDSEETREIEFLREPLEQFATWTRVQQRIRDAKGSLRIQSTEKKFIFDEVMRTADAVSPHSVGTLAGSLALFVVVYLFVFGAGFAYMMRLVRKGPVPEEGSRDAPGGPGRQRQPMRPLSAADEDDDHPTERER